MKALALFSGGLDSALAIKVVQNQGIEVIALNFVSYFFGGKNPKIDSMAKQLNIDVMYINFKEEQKKLIENPLHGLGKNMNPCIDCHGLMLNIAGNLLEEYNADFIITGEVLGQRPMSQNYHALDKVENLSGYPGLVLRPLSAKLLKETTPENKGWIKRELLLDIQGRSRKRQITYAKEFNITEYPSPAGGCLLTDPIYSNRLRVLKDDNQFSKTILFELIKNGRFIRLDEGKYIIAGRRHEDNLVIDEYINQVDFYIRGNKTPGPTVLGVGSFNEQEISFAKQIFARYSSTKGNDVSSIIYNNQEEEVPTINVEQVSEKIKKYMVM